MIPKETKEKLIKMVREELDLAALGLGKPEETAFYSASDYDSDEYDYSCSWKTASGATKFVLFPPDMNYVIKIPFNGFYINFDKYVDNYYEEHEYNSETEDEVRKMLKAAYYDEDFLSLLEPFMGASETGGWDYCAREVYLSEQAKDWGLEEFFVPTELLFYYQGYPIYVQEKCDVEYDAPMSYPCTEEARVCSKYTFERDQVWLDYLAETDWLASAYYLYGEDKVKELIEFIKTFDLCDLKNDNRGTRDGKPVIVDYCGFNE